MTRWNAIFLFIGIAALSILVWDVGVGTLAEGLARVGWGFLAGASCHFMALAVDAYALKRCTGAEGARVPYWQYLRAALCGHAINQVTPLATLGEFTKYSLLREHIPKERVAAALIVFNILLFFSAATIVGLLAPIVVLIAGIGGPVLLVVLSASVVLAVISGILWLILTRGTGEWPFRIARRLGISARRIRRARRTWHGIEDTWKHIAGERRRLALTYAVMIVSRTFNCGERAILLYLLGYHGAPWLAVLMMANNQVVIWTTGFVPMGAGTAEGGAYLFFRAVGLNPYDGVVVELVLKIRRILFAALGMLLLGGHAFMQALVKPPRSATSSSSLEPEAIRSAEQH